jgi:acetylornithine aminotransferase/acetylornithine/N-succinyldiaminopimelate aminotransferase
MWDTDGNTYWDFYGGHAVTLIGQAHPHWVDALTRQAKSLSFFTGLAPVPVRTEATALWCAFTGMDVAWFVNSGAEANEAALKIARKATGRPVIVAMVKGFHGRTMGALGVTWKYRDQHAPIHGEARFVPFGDLDALKQALGPDVAGVIVEPVQGIAGIIEPPKGYLAGVAELCKLNGSLLICDEVQCGIGRMGHPLVSTGWGVKPDVVTVGKGVGGGFPVAAALLSKDIVQTISPGEHGTTFGGAPLACAAVRATIEIIQREDLMKKAVELGEQIEDSMRSIGAVQSIRGRGAWIGITLDRPAKPVVRALLSQGFMVGTASDPYVLRLSPPAIMPKTAVKLLARALKNILVQPIPEAA